MKKHILLMPLLLLLSGLILFMPRLAAAAQDPVSMLSSISDQMIASLKAHKTNLKSNPSLVYSLAYKIVVPHANIDMMAKRVLPASAWNSATPSQRAQFQKEFTNLLVHTYASALADYTDETVRFYPVRGGYQGKTIVKVSSEIIRSDGPSIPVSYQLVSSGGEWRLYDMSVEGVSMLESFRSQFADKLNRGNIDELISALRQHNMQ